MDGRGGGLHPGEAARYHVLGSVPPGLVHGHAAAPAGIRRLRDRDVDARGVDAGESRDDQGADAVDRRLRPDLQHRPPERRLPVHRGEDLHGLAARPDPAPGADLRSHLASAEAEAVQLPPAEDPVLGAGRLLHPAPATCAELGGSGVLHGAEDAAPAEASGSRHARWWTTRLNARLWTDADLPGRPGNPHL